MTNKIFSGLLIFVGIALVLVGFFFQFKIYQKIFRTPEKVERLEAKIAELEQEIKEIKSKVSLITEIKQTLSEIEDTKAKIKTLQANQYEVKKGDCLWNIQKHSTGSGKTWAKLFTLNKSKIKNPHIIFPGQKLALN